jgi:hypothetical protein
MSRTLILVATLLMLAAQAYAAADITEMTAKEAVEKYRLGDRETIIFVLGALDGLMMANGYLQVQKSRQIYCGPFKFSTDDIFGILAGFIARYPAMRPIIVANVLLEALLDAYPCRQ